MHGDREDEIGFEIAAVLYRGAFAGWEVPTMVTADALMRPLRYVVLDEGNFVRGAGFIEPAIAVGRGETFAVEVPRPRPRGAAWSTPAATMVVRGEIRRRRRRDGSCRGALWSGHGQAPRDPAGVR